MHLADAFIQSDLQCIQAIHYKCNVYVYINYFILFSSAHFNLFTGEWMSQPHWSVSRQALVVLRAAHAGFSSVCVSPLRQSQLTVIIVRHNNGLGCSAGGQRSHCAIRPSQALADLCSQSSVALDKLARKKRQKSDYLIISERTNWVNCVNAPAKNKWQKWERTVRRNGTKIQMPDLCFACNVGHIETQLQRELPHNWDLIQWLL